MPHIIAFHLAVPLFMRIDYDDNNDNYNNEDNDDENDESQELSVAS